MTANRRSQSRPFMCDRRLMMSEMIEGATLAEWVDQLQRKNDELVARVARLEQVQLNALEYIGSLDATPMTIKLHDLVAVAENETQTQSLQRIEAAAVEKALDECAWYHDREFIKIDELIAYTDKLRQQSTNGSDGDE